MRSPPPKKVRFDLTRPKSTPPLSSSINFGTTEAIKRTPQTRVYTHSKSLDTNSYLDACQKCYTLKFRSLLNFYFPWFVLWSWSILFFMHNLYYTQIIQN